MLHVVRSHDPVVLVDRLAAVLSEPVDDPFTPEVVAVHSRGIERWLQQELAVRLGTRRGDDGVAANLRFPFPGRLAGEVLARASGVPAERDPWQVERLAWAVLAVLADEPDGPWGATLRHHLAPDAVRHGHRTAVARRVARLLDRYAAHRPDLLVRWVDGDDVGTHGGRLDARHAWQPAVLRRLRERLAVPSPAERLVGAAARLRADGDPELPSRLVLHGLTALPVAHLHVLVALSARHDVHLHLLHPAPSRWTGDRRVRARVDEATGLVRLPPRRVDVEAHNELLASWGRDALELGDVVAALGPPDRDVVAPGGRLAPTDSLLGIVQRGLVDDVALRPTSAQPTLPLAPPPSRDDTSLQVHACHGARRQVEALRDLLAHAFAADATLRPRDVLVMCPDIERFAPLLHAVLDDEQVGPGFRLRLADRSLRRTNPLLDVLDDLLELAARPLRRSDLLALLRRRPVMTRFALTEHDVETITGWLDAADVRWGHDADERARWGVPGATRGTVTAALDRLAVGVARDEDPVVDVGGAVPLAAVGGTDAGLLGRFAELAERLDDVRTSFRSAAPVVAWADRLDQAATLLTRVRGDDAWQRRELTALLDELADEALDVDGRPSTVPLGVADVRVLLADRLRGRPSRVDHRTGDLTACTLVPMRSVPHRVVVLLGMDDDAFPRRVVPDGDDLVAARPRVGDHDPRDEDRQLLLDAVLAARERLVVLHSSHDERTGERRPPAAVVTELLEQVAGVLAPAEDAATPAVLVQHPRDAGAAALFDAGAPVLLPGPSPVPGIALAAPSAVARPFSFDARALPTSALPPPAVTAAPPSPPPVVGLDDLARRLGDPLVEHARERLGVRVPFDGPPTVDHLDTQLGALDDRNLKARVAHAMARGRSAEQTAAHLERAGLLPPASGVEADLVRWGHAWSRVLEEHLGGDVPTAVAVRVVLPDGREVVGRVAGVGLADGVVRATEPSNDAPKRILAAWVRLLALTAGHPERSWTHRTVLKDGTSGFRVRSLVLPGGSSAARRAAAVDHLGRLVRLHDLAREAPPPVTSSVLAGLGLAGAPRARVYGEQALLDLRSEQLDGPDVVAEGREAELLGAEPGTDRVAAWAAALWQGLADGIGVLELDVDGVLADEVVA